MTRLRHYLGAGTLAALALALHQPAQAAEDGQTIINAKCQACHTPEGNNSLSRISHQRKTPEGWLMSIARMQVMYGLKITDEERRSVVKFLADKQGLAPSETDGVRYALERRLNTVEHFDTNFEQMCARCHSAARIALQRRPAAEWEKLVNFHLGRWPSLEYQALSRDRDWFDLARKEMVPELAKRFPLDNQAWSDWKKDRPKAESLAGEWSFAGHMPGRGDISGVMSVASKGGDQFKVAVKGKFADGEAFDGEGSAVLYNGYEWRGNVAIGDTTMRQVFAALNGRMQGRMFDKSHDERGLDFVAAQQGSSRVLGVQPAYLKAGGEAEVSVIGSGLSGTPSFGPGVEVLSVVAQSPERVTVKVKASDSAAVGERDVTVGTAKGGSLAVYKEIAEVKVVPEFSVSRIGGNGGSTPKVQGSFDAEAWGKGADGKPFRIGVFPAQWSVEPFDDRAREDQDVKFAGEMDAATGIFTPGDAGPNPARKMMTNNAGNLKVIAAVDDAGQSHKGEGHMIVTVQRWNNPPIP
ncbi:quinohemoprotein amine dehydrogenase subunit alpha [Pseudomonas sp. ZM23]|uniref:Quinohemoprotein amine dehydrogenase subunit alpha n=1 Tax=Pseudomonas triclosanedens TaxID=2961893 RepID=A0ABY7A5G6_9PSED|nr:quinohemoprotein amine dehydrogenase subunit alpha [Pseudomonas triclosanedens]MCP8465493.1 quinohemoprotein amine dehydrogenase subunit alpha [Pseudomonas triclosanedens]MCP8470988.1 quinohemoprotein amine dehydrogenase subunit alpha [Pseudomonas triclosanedens]MCP8476792.1 quinohemoprotein amine dehydrogenase subunit alpha [Pseudomonas triclosanedens]WAI52482.1 quinohemoprotein amine dehydrogenase subunit alpha [Pseudomonas triclosanedens]